jgi:hypothetical protein
MILKINAKVHKWQLPTNRIRNLLTPIAFFSLSLPQCIKNDIFIFLPSIECLQYCSLHHQDIILLIEKKSSNEKFLDLNVERVEFGNEFERCRIVVDYVHAVNGYVIIFRTYSNLILWNSMAFVASFLMTLEL